VVDWLNTSVSQLVREGGRLPIAGTTREGPTPQGEKNREKAAQGAHTRADQDNRIGPGLVAWAETGSSWFLTEFP
jgi:hypothetical protein